MNPTTKTFLRTSRRDTGIDKKISELTALEYTV